jgi:hypothetical protein
VSFRSVLPWCEQCIIRIECRGDMDQYRIYPSTPLVPLVACDNTDDGEIADKWACHH